MQRFFEKTLQDWKESGMKKPLMVVGARQIGKTDSIKNFAEKKLQEILHMM